MIYGFVTNNVPACFVISCGGGIVTCISLFGKNETAYNQWYGKMAGLAEKYGFENKDPHDHEEIHEEMGRLMNVDPDSTKTHNTHFHWVGKMDKDNFPVILLEMKKWGCITTQQLQLMVPAIDQLAEQPW